MERTGADEAPPGTRILRMNNLQDDGWDLDDMKYVNLSTEETARYILQPGDLLFNRTNSKELVGKCAVFQDLGEWVFASYLMRVRIDKTQALPEFVATFLNTQAGRVQIDRLSRAIIGMSNINAEEIRELLVPTPTLSVQRELMAKIDAARTNQQRRLENAGQLLADVDDYVLEILGLNLKAQRYPRAFAARLGELSERADPDFNSPKFRELRRWLNDGKFPARLSRNL